MVFRRFLRDERAQSVVEFGLALPFLVLMSVGTFAVGMIIDRHLTLGQVVRNGGNMYARGVDFSSTQNKQFIIDAATGLDLQLTSGKSAVYFTLLTRVPDDAKCSSGYSQRDCNNNGRIVIAQRYKIGNTTATGMGSRLQSGQNATQFVDKSGNAASEGDHLNHFDLVEAWADNAPSALTNTTTGLQENELIYVVEIVHKPTTISFQGIFAPEYMYARAFF
ncbi:MAG: hypothetical protein GC160_05950 [Acidobacteria bacterium]|nr:hypothetical protein [Acidobacteriota bacterium]